MTYAPNDVNVILHTAFDQPAQIFSEMFPLETGAYITEEINSFPVHAVIGKRNLTRIWVISLTALLFRKLFPSDFAQKNVSSGLAYLSGSPFLCVFSDLKLFPQ